MQAYIAANKKFTDRVVELLAPENDFVWVQDYHLLLLPTLLRKRFHTVRIGFFLHCPFPSSEMFRAFPMRSELLRGLLNADLVGFHTFDYARHFLPCCRCAVHPLAGRPPRPTNRMTAREKKRCKLRRQP